MSELSDSLDGLNATASNAGNMVLTGKNNRKNRRFAKEQWERNNEYNSIKNQVKRMKEGGMNPALMYQGTPQNVSQNMNPPEGEAPQSDPYLSTKIKQAQAQTNLTAEQAATVQTKQDLMLTQMQLMSKQIESLGYKNIETQVDTDMKSGILTENAKRQGEIMQASVNRLRQDFEQKNQLFPYQKSALDLSNKKTEVETSKLRQELAQMPELQRITLLKMGAEIKNLGKQATLMDYQNLFQKYEAPFRQSGINPNDSSIPNMVAKFGVLFSNALTNLTK